MNARYVEPEGTKRGAIREIYAAVKAPAWASPNLDGLADVLRDLSWLPPGPVTLVWQPSGRLPQPARRSIETVLRAAAAESTTSDHPLHIAGLD